MRTQIQLFLVAVPNSINLPMPERHGASKDFLPSVTLYELACFNESDIIVAGSVQTTYRSIDGGETWSDTNQVPVAGTLNTVFALEGTSSAYCAGTSGKVFKSNDKGAIWTLAGNAAGTINSIWFPTPAIGWAVGNSGKIYKSVNYGGSWSTTTSITSNDLQSVRFSDANNGIIVGYGGVILKTTDGGTTWTKSAQVTGNHLLSATLIDGSTTLAVGYAGNIIKSSNAPLPVELVSFTASVRNNLVNLNWETATEVDNYGFEIERKDKNSDWTKIGFIEGHFTSNSPKYYMFSDKPTGSSKYSYRLKQIDNDGKFEYSGIVEVDLSGMLPKDIEIKNFPNPFNPETNINIKLPETAQTTVELYNSTGEKIFTIYKGKLDVGTTLSLKVDGSNLPSGVYLINVSAGKYRKTHKILLMK
ncbi:MAG: T9SS type A sorting domain-containing protein [Ignavibacteriales bacterium]|nr:T9SS type A sorting domain-containing protein [Ignavibacteriales bacterium]